jgi:hypothetical protein
VTALKERISNFEKEKEVWAQNYWACSKDNDEMRAENAALEKRVRKLEAIFQEQTDELMNVPVLTCASGNKHTMDRYRKDCVYCMIEEKEAENNCLREALEEATIRVHPPHLTHTNAIGRKEGAAIQNHEPVYQDRGCETNSTMEE